MCRRRSAEKMKTADEAHDLELGGVLDRRTPGRSNDFNTLEGRGFSMGNPPKGRAASRSTDGGIMSYGASPTGTDGPSSQTHPSPGRCIAMGKNQRGRSLSRGRSEGPRMYRSSPGQVSATSHSPGAEGAYTPGRSGSFRTPRRTMSNGRDDLRGHQMYDHSVDEGYDGGRGRRSSRSPRAFVSRSRSAGRSRRPPTGDEFDRGERQLSVTPGRRRSSGISPDGRLSRSPHVLGMRRSKSEGRADDHSQDSARHETVDEDVDASRWEHDGMMPAVGTIERGRRSQRLSMANSQRSKSMHDTSKLGRLDSKGQYDWEDNARSKSATPSRQTYRNGLVRFGFRIVVVGPNFGRLAQCNILVEVPSAFPTAKARFVSGLYECPHVGFTDAIGQKTANKRKPTCRGSDNQVEVRTRKCGLSSWRSLILFFAYSFLLAYGAHLRLARV